MKVLLLSPYFMRLAPALEAVGDDYLVQTEPISREYCDRQEIEFIVSYGYRHIIRRDVLALFPGKIINLHISLLPWCRGAHPVFWSVVEGRPLGASIHLIDDGLDTGDLLIQRQFDLDLGAATFRTLYDLLSCGIESLFLQNWQDLRLCRIQPTPQPSGGSIHRANEINDWGPFLPSSWDTDVLDFLAQSNHKLDSLRSLF